MIGAGVVTFQLLVPCGLSCTRSTCSCAVHTILHSLSTVRIPFVMGGHQQGYPLAFMLEELMFLNQPHLLLFLAWLVFLLMS